MRYNHDVRTRDLRGVLWTRRTLWSNADSFSASGREFLWDHGVKHSVTFSTRRCGEHTRGGFCKYSAAKNGVVGRG